MAVREILTFPSSELKRKALDVKNIDSRVDELASDMVETMYDAPGVGLAAPQLGVAERLVVLDVNTEEPGVDLLKLINPVIEQRHGTVLWEEGCLSVIDYTAEVKRSAEVWVRAWTPDEKEIEIEADGLLAVALQHEIDHLDGKLFIDRLSSLKRDLYKRKLKKILRDGAPIASDERAPGL